VLQYAMRERLMTLGFTDIEVIDDDLGRSAAGSVQRAGFERMVAEICLGKKNRRAHTIWFSAGHEMPIETRCTWKARTSSRLSRSGGAAEMPAKLGDGADVGSLRRRRQIADRHVLDHASAQRAHRGHRVTSCLRGGMQHPGSSQAGHA
jgi:hypothetical protein